MTNGRQTIAAALTEAAKLLDASGVNEARRNAALLLQFVLGRDKTYLIAHNDEFLTNEQQARLDSFTARHASGEPVQYITGRTEFFGLAFEIDKNVLIPRPETEILVEAALERFAQNEQFLFCDVGTGSGCIAVSILVNRPNARAVALDLSSAALGVALRNVEKHNVSQRIEFYQSNVFEVFEDLKFEIRNLKFDCIVSNPPYIPQSDEPDLQREVRDFEPHLALFSGADGLDVVRRLLLDAPPLLKDNGYLLFEIGFGQSNAVRELVDKDVWQSCEFQNDLQGIPRTVILQKK